MSCSPVLEILPARNAGWNIVYSSCSFTNTYNTYIKLSNQTPSLLHSNWLNNPPKNQSHSTSQLFAVQETAATRHSLPGFARCHLPANCGSLKWVDQWKKSCDVVYSIGHLPYWSYRIKGCSIRKPLVFSNSSTLWLADHHWKIIYYSIELINQTFEQTFKNPWNLSENPWKSYVPLTCSS